MAADGSAPGGKTDRVRVERQLLPELPNRMPVSDNLWTIGQSTRSILGVADVACRGNPRTSEDRIIVATLALLDTAPHTHAADPSVTGPPPGPGAVGLPPGAEPLDKATDGRLTEALAALGATGKEGEVVKLSTFGALVTPLVVAAGLGPAADRYRPEAVRRA